VAVVLARDEFCGAVEVGLEVEGEAEVDLEVEAEVDLEVEAEVDLEVEAEAEVDLEVEAENDEWSGSEKVGSVAAENLEEEEVP
jgi:hypothetical protein